MIACTECLFVSVSLFPMAVKGIIIPLLNFTSVYAHVNLYGPMPYLQRLLVLAQVTGLESP